MNSLLNFIDRWAGRRSLALLLVCALTACSTLHAVEGSGRDLHERIRDGSVVRPGDTVRVSTDSGSPQEFRVTAVEQDELVGAGVRVPIDSITALEIRDYRVAKNTAKTIGLLILGTVLVVGYFAMQFSQDLEFSSSGG